MELTGDVYTKSVFSYFLYFLIFISHFLLSYKHVDLKTILYLGVKVERQYTFVEVLSVRIIGKQEPQKLILTAKYFKLWLNIVSVFYGGI